MIEHTAAQVLQTYLYAVGFGTKPNDNRPWPLYENRMPPDHPNDAMSINDTDGIMDGREMRGGRTVEHPGVQLMVRSTVDGNGKKKALSIYPVWDAILNEVVVISGKSYKIDALTRTSPVYTLGQEQDGTRFLFSVNGIITYSEL